jgi:methionine biosynthesis protein MetW
MKNTPIAPLERADLQQIAFMIDKETRVLDVGSGDGGLLYYLKHAKHIDGRGIELNPLKVGDALAKGVAVIQGDAEQELPEYPDKSFDYVVLSRTLPATRQPIKMIKQMLRIGKRSILSMPNFGYWRVRTHLLLQGTMPVTTALEQNWYDTDNIHLCTIKDFLALAKKLNITIEKSYAITNNKVTSFVGDSFLANLLAEEVIFMFKNNDE